MNIPYSTPRIGAPFPTMFGQPLINTLVRELEESIQAPKSLIFSSVISAISLVLQGVVDVQKPRGGTVPCSIMLLCIADSGERKSTTDKIVFKAIRDVQHCRSVEYKEACDEWKMKFDLWDVRCRAIKRKIGKSVERGEDTAELEAEYKKQVLEKPVPPRKFKILYEDATSAALFLGLHQETPSAGMITSEGGGVLTGSALNDLSKQNALWSGDDIHVDRVSRESFTISGARLTVSMMVQEKVFSSYMQKSGEISRGSGLWARFLVCKPESMQGKRFINGNEMIFAPSMDLFAERLTSMLSENLLRAENNNWKRTVVEFDELARERWVELFNFIESGIGEGGFWAGMQDHASKLADNIARLAALFHCFEQGVGGKISSATLASAVQVGMWYSGEFAKLFSREGRIEADANLLVRWMEERSRAMCSSSLRKNYILRHGPSRLRSKLILDEILLYLEFKAIVKLDYYSGAMHVALYPAGRHRYSGDPISQNRGF